MICMTESKILMEYLSNTGLADPAPVAQTFFVDEEVTNRYKLDGIITVVDAKHIIPRIEEEKPEDVENEAVEQLAFTELESVE